MENVFVYVEDGGGISELRGVPVVMGGKYGGLKGAVNPENVSFWRLIR